MRFLQLWIARFLVVVSWLGVNTNRQDIKWLSYEPTVVELEGKLTVEMKYGPPNYGENPKTDERVRVPLLLLSQAVNVRGDPKSDLNAESVKGVTRIQLVFKGGTTYRQFTGKKVVVKGTLFRGHTGHHYTDVLMTVLEIRKNQREKRD